MAGNTVWKGEGGRRKEARAGRPHGLPFSKTLIHQSHNWSYSEEREISKQLARLTKATFTSLQRA